MKTKSHKKGLMRIGAVLCLMGLWVLIPFALNKVEADESRDTRIEGSLTGPAIDGVTPAGYTEFRRDDDGRKRLKVQATSVNLPAGTVLDPHPSAVQQDVLGAQRQAEDLEGGAEEDDAAQDEQHHTGHAEGNLQG